MKIADCWVTSTHALFASKRLFLTQQYHTQYHVSNYEQLIAVTTSWTRTDTAAIEHSAVYVPNSVTDISNKIVLFESYENKTG